jgi:predicted MFS family arabinose efflux permease
MPTADAAAAPASPRTPTYSWVVLAMLCFIYTFNFLDRQLMSILTEPIKQELGLTDSQMGRLGGIYFAAFYTILGVFVGFFADRFNRVWILGVGSAVWSLMTALCGVAKTYPMLMAARMGVGVGEAAGAPPSYSIISDYFPAHKRGMALGIFSLGVPFGMALGAGLGGWIAASHGWRMAFISIGVAGLIATVFLLLIVREPKRGAQEVKLDPHMAEAPTTALDIEKPGFFKTAGEFFGRPALLFTALGCGATAFVGYGILNWTAPFLIRVKGVNMAEISLWYSLELAVFMGLGTWLSGQIADWLSRRARYWYALVPMIALIIAVPFYIGFIWAPSWQMSLAFLAVPTLLNNTYLAPALAVVQNSVKPSQRTMSGALLLLVLNLVGLGLGPTFVGELSSHFTLGNIASALSVSAEQAATYATMTAAQLREQAPEIAQGVAAAGAKGLQTALYWLTPFYGVAVAILVMEALALAAESRKAKAA